MVKENVVCLCFDLKNFPRSTQFVLLSVTVFVFHIIQGYMNELIFQLEGFKPFSMFLTLLQFGFYAILALIDIFISNRFSLNILFKTRVTRRTYLILSILTVFTLGMSNTAVANLNFVTFNMFKSCKLIPVMIGSILVLGKKYNVYDKLAVVSMSLGLIFFTLADSNVNPAFNFYGVLIVLLALIGDALIGNYQEKTMKTMQVTNSEIVFFSYSIGFIIILIWEFLVMGRLVDAFLFCNDNVLETYGYIFIFSFNGYFGLNVVLSLVNHFGALLAVTVTTCRKAITIWLSFLLFAKPFTFQYLWSGLLVFIGIYLNLYSKNQTSWNLYFKSYIFNSKFLFYKKILKSKKLIIDV